MILIELLANLYDAIIGTYFVLKFNNGKLKNNRQCYFVVFLCFAISTVFLFVQDLSLIHTLMITLVLLVCSFSIKEHTTFTAFLSPMIFEVTLAGSSTLLVLTLSVIFGIDVVAIATGFSFARCLLLFLSKVVITSVCLLILRLYSPGKRVKPLDWMLYLISPAITIVSLYAFLSISMLNNMERYYVLIAVSSIGLVVTNILAVVFFTKYSKNEQAKFEMQIMLHLRETEQQKYEEAQKVYESVKILRHDLKEQILYAKELFNRGDFKAAEDHIAKLENKVSVTNNVAQTGNRIIDSVLYSKISINPSVKFIVSGTIDDLSHIDEIELVSLLSNMIDNAIDAIYQHDEKMIEISFLTIGGYQNISCKNPIVKSALKENPDLTTTKNNKNIHGYGIKSMRKSIESMKGMIEFYEKDNYFICHAAIPIN